MFATARSTAAFASGSTGPPIRRLPLTEAVNILRNGEASILLSSDVKSLRIRYVAQESYQGTMYASHYSWQWPRANRVENTQGLCQAIRTPASLCQPCTTDDSRANTGSSKPVAETRSWTDCALARRSGTSDRGDCRLSYVCLPTPHDFVNNALG